MKTILKTFVATVVACALVSCNKEAVAPDNNGEYVKVSFLADAQDVSTKATLTPDDEDAVFSSAWEVKDKLSVEYMSFAGEGSSGVVDAVWNGTSFDAVINDGSKGEWSYDAIFPAPQAKSVDFGSSRTQKGNSYNSKYDLMESGAIFFTDAEAGKTDDGKPVKFQMNRQTGIAYFHLKSSLAEETIVSATLSVKGGYVASSSVTVKDYANGYDLSTKDLDSITLTFENGTAPAADDFKLWFNVLPTDYTSLTLAIETTGHTATITNATAGSYKAGQLYKVAGNIDSKLVAKPVEEDKVFFYESFDTNDGTGGNDDKWNGSIAFQNISSDNSGWAFSYGKGANQCAKFGTGEAAGSATTPKLGITSGEATLWFKAGAWNGNKETLNISVTASGDAKISQSSFVLVKGMWTEYSCVISGADETTKVSFAAMNASNNRFFLDEIYVYTGKKPTVKANQTISFAQTDCSCYVDEVFSSQELTGAKTTVTYSSSDENVATVDATTGTVTIIAAGSTTIKALAEETEEYRSASASYKLTVSKRTQAISFEKSHYSVVLADKDNFASPKVSGAETEVTYSITLADGMAADAVTIDSKTGEVTINAIGTATVTATAAETSIYKGNSATYNLKVSESVEAKTVKYSVASTSSVTVSGEAPTGSSVIFKDTYSTKEQLTKGNSMTFTLSGYSGKIIKKVTLSMKSNKKEGSGTFSLTAGMTELASINSSTTFNKWYDSNGYSTSYKDVNVIMANDSYTIGNGEKVVLIIAATANSLYCQSVTIVYE